MKTLGFRGRLSVAVVMLISLSSDPLFSDDNLIWAINQNTNINVGININTHHSTAEMANTSVTPGMRAAGWNVVFSVGNTSHKFAGIYQVRGSNLVTFRNVIDELRLCFEFDLRTENDSGNAKDGEDTDSTQDSWDDVTFALLGRPGALGSAGPTPTFIQKDDRDQPVLSLPPRAPKQPVITRYHLIRHKTCSLGADKSLAEHLKG
ncbi:hypothetical protein BKA60DRAFT_586791 [Fusarium oxysporum]|nr:hypothetical protein BKA60DRAFT_586791 [Fusarium oxysporum]